MKRRISIFGSTGSIGENTVDLLVRAGGAEAFDVVALTGGHNVQRLAEQAQLLKAQVAVTCHPENHAALKEALAGSGVQAAAGPAAMLEAATRPADWIMSAIVGSAGLMSGFGAVRQGATLALANKESLVAAGPLLMAEARAHSATILPVDSEHSAIFQSLLGEDINAVSHVTITASGGAFRDWPMDKIASATPEQAATHPNWDMGKRITIDSASMFNKALEVIETKEFFGFRPEQIKVVVHPESLIHAMVSFADGGTMAHLGAPDMRHAIGFALNWPDRKPLPVPMLDLAAAGQLNFRHADPERYPALRLAWEVMQIGGLAGAAFNASKESALDAFIDHRIGFLDMAGVVDEVLNRLLGENCLTNAAITLDNVFEVDALARIRTKQVIQARQTGN